MVIHPQSEQALCTQDPQCQAINYQLKTINFLSRIMGGARVAQAAQRCQRGVFARGGGGMSFLESRKAKHQPPFTARPEAVASRQGFPIRVMRHILVAACRNIGYSGAQ